MSIFTTREVAIFIYGLLLLMYILIRKNGKDILLPVIKAACHIKLVIPFCMVLLFAASFVWACTYLPFWDWVYIKDIALFQIYRIPCSNNIINYSYTISRFNFRFLITIRR